LPYLYENVVSTLIASEIKTEDISVLCIKNHRSAAVVTESDYNLSSGIMSPPMKWGDLLFLAPLSVCPSVCPSHFRVRSISFEPWLDLQITSHKCQVWWDDVQCLSLTKVGSRSRSQSKIKHCMIVFRVRSISFEPLVGFTNNFAQM